MKRMVVGGALAALLLVAAQPVFAQQDAPSPRQLELAHKLIDATGMRDSLAGTMRNMMQQAFASANTSQASSPAAQAKVKAIEQAEEDMMTKLTPKIVDISVDAYARTYSEQELSDMLAFYQSPSGRSMKAKAPQMVRTMMGDMVKLMPEMRREMGEEICANTACSEAEKTAYFGKPANH